MSLTGDEIRHRLSTFAAKWSVYAGGEREYDPFNKTPS
jgi:hypothetical protein